MYSLDCSYYNKEFKTLNLLLEDIKINGMDPSYQVTKNGKGMGELAEDFIVF